MKKTISFSTYASAYFISASIAAILFAFIDIGVMYVNNMNITLPLKDVISHFFYGISVVFYT